MDGPGHRLSTYLPFAISKVVTKISTLTVRSLPKVFSTSGALATGMAGLKTDGAKVTDISPKGMAGRRRMASPRLSASPTARMSLRARTLTLVFDISGNTATARPSVSAVFLTSTSTNKVGQTGFYGQGIGSSATPLV